MAALLTVRPGHEAALAAALGGIADAVAVSSPDEAAAALHLLKTDDGGRAGLLVGTSSADLGQVDVEEPRDALTQPRSAGWGGLPAGAQWAVELVEAPRELRGAVGRALDRVAVVGDLDAARALVAERPEVRAVTADGDLLGADWAVGGSASAPSVIEVQAAVDEADQRLAEAEARRTRLAGELATAKAAADTARVVVDRALSELHESDAKLNAVAEQLGQLGAGARSAGAEADRLDRARAVAAEARERDLTGLADLEARLEAAEGAGVDEEPDTGERDALQAEAPAARQAEMEARLAVRTGEERVRALAGRADSLLRAAATERAARARQEERRRARARGAAVAGAVARAAEAALVRIAASLVVAADERDAAQQARVVREGELLALRSSSRELAAELERLTDVVHRDEVARAEQRLRIEQLETVAVEEYGVDLDALVGEYGPDLLVPPSAAEVAGAEADGAEAPRPRPRTSGRCRRSGPPGPSGTWPCWAR